MGGKAKSTSTSQQGSAQTWAQPFAQDAVNQVQSVVNQNQPGLQALTDLTRNQVVSPLLGKFTAGLGGTNQARDYYQNILGGGMMTGNPYLNSVVAQTGRDVTNGVNSQFELNGRYGSDAHGYGLARGLADSENSLRYQNYSDEAARRDAAAQSLNQMNAADVSSLLSAIGAGAQIPYTGTSNLANSLGALFNGGTSNSVQVGPSPIWGAVGAGLGALGSVFQGKG